MEVRGAGRRVAGERVPVPRPDRRGAGDAGGLLRLALARPGGDTQEFELDVSSHVC